jgi:hypothetical protein
MDMSFGLNGQSIEALFPTSIACHESLAQGVLDSVQDQTEKVGSGNAIRRLGVCRGSFFAC